MRWTTNTTTMREHSHRASPQSDYSQMSADAGSDIRTKRSSAPSARLWELRILREYTHSSSSSSRSSCRSTPREAPRHVSSRPYESQSQRAWMFESEAERRALGAAPDSSIRRWLECSKFKKLTPHPISHSKTVSI